MRNIKVIYILKICKLMLIMLKIKKIIDLKNKMELIEALFLIRFLTL